MPKSFPSFCSSIHNTVTLSSGPLLAQRWPEQSQVLHPKIAASWHSKGVHPSSCIFEEWRNLSHKPSGVPAHQISQKWVTVPNRTSIVKDDRITSVGLDPAELTPVAGPWAGASLPAAPSLEEELGYLNRMGALGGNEPWMNHRSDLPQGPDPKSICPSSKKETLTCENSVCLNTVKRMLTGDQIP